MIIAPIEDVLFLTVFSDNEGVSVTSAWWTYESAKGHSDWLKKLGYDVKLFVKILGEGIIND